MSVALHVANGALQNAPARAVSVRSRIAKCRKFYVQFSDVIASGMIAALNSVVLAARLIRHIPSIIPYLAQTGLGYCGCLWLPSMIKDWIKSCRDLGNAIKTKDFFGVVWTLFKVQFQIIDVLCIPGGVVASLFGVFGKTHVTMRIYRLMRPFALYALALSCLGQLIDYFINKRLIKKMQAEILSGNNLEQKQRIADRFTRAILTAAEKRGKLSSKSKIDQLAVKVVRQLDMFSLNAFLKSPEVQTVVRVDNLCENLQCRQLYTVKRLRMSVIDYGLMVICKMYPQTVLQATILCGRSLIAFKMTLFEKLKVRKIYKRSSNVATH